MDRQEGYYWVKYGGEFEIAEYNFKFKDWYIIGSNDVFEDSDFEHINENRILQPGEIPE